MYLDVGAKVWILFRWPWDSIIVIIFCPQSAAILCSAAVSISNFWFVLWSHSSYVIVLLCYVQLRSYYHCGVGCCDSPCHSQSFQNVSRSELFLQCYSVHCAVTCMYVTVFIVQERVCTLQCSLCSNMYVCCSAHCAVMCMYATVFIVQ
jgi:hypothetical protein